MPRYFLELLAELAWSMWAWPAIEAQGDWPFFLFTGACCLGGLALGGGIAMTMGGELRAAVGPASPAPAGVVRAAGWALGRVVGALFGTILALGGAWGLVCLARVGWLSL